MQSILAKRRLYGGDFMSTDANTFENTLIAAAAAAALSTQNIEVRQRGGLGRGGGVGGTRGGIYNSNQLSFLAQ